MKKKKFQILVFLTLIMAIVGCERDDICAEATQTTPALLVEFRDFSEPENLKSVRQLRVIAIDDNENVIDTLVLPSQNPNTLSLPLLIRPEFDENGEQNIVTTRYVLEKNSDLADNDEDDNDSEIVVLEINYANEFIYVSRACGYKSVFRLEPITGIRVVPVDEPAWVRNTRIENELIENENEAKVLILH